MEMESIFSASFCFCCFSTCLELQLNKKTPTINVIIDVVIIFFIILKLKKLLEKAYFLSNRTYFGISVLQNL